MTDRIELPPMTDADRNRILDWHYGTPGAPTLDEAVLPARKRAYRLGYVAGIRDEKNRPRTIGAEREAGHWWCPECKLEVHPRQVSYEERHESCGARVKWKEPRT